MKKRPKRQLNQPDKSSILSSQKWSKIIKFTFYKFVVFSDPQKCLGQVTFLISTWNYYLITLKYSQLRPYFKKTRRSFWTWMGHNLSGPGSDSWNSTNVNVLFRNHPGPKSWIHAICSNFLGILKKSIRFIADFFGTKWINQDLNVLI